MPTMKKLKSNSKTSLHSRSSSSTGSSLSNTSSNNNNETTTQSNNNNRSPYFDITKYMKQENFVQQKWQQERLRQEVGIHQSHGFSTIFKKAPVGFSLS